MTRPAGRDGAEAYVRSFTRSTDAGGPEPEAPYDRASLEALARMVGRGPEVFDLLDDVELLVPFLLRDIPGPVGSGLRLEWYKPFFGRLGEGVRIGAGATFLNPKLVRIGDNSLVDDGAYLDARRGHGIEAGENVRICNGAYLVPHQPEGFVRIGNNSYIGARSQVFGHGGVSIGDYVLAAPGLMIVPYQHEFGDKDKMIANQGGETGPVVIGDDVYLGQSVKILHGVTIGRGSVVGAGALVTKDVEPFSVVAGVPARVLRRRGETPRNG